MDEWIYEAVTMTGDEFIAEREAIIYQWAKYNDPEQHIIVEELE